MKKRRICIAVVSIIAFISMIVMFSTNIKINNTTKISTVNEQDKNYTAGSKGDTYKLKSIGTIGRL